ncbi:MAG: hypothetical protein K2X39_05555 [Silvanigrellaceae bacterium]|nr:hypothetical protein [Silvanigrellaceae bacterium]
MDFQSTNKEYIKLKKSYEQYLAVYKLLNKGSLEGVTSFSDFYIYRTFTSKYTDRRKFLANVYR